MDSNTEKFTPPDCTRFGGIMPDGQVKCKGDGCYMAVPPNFCHCAEQYHNQFDRTKTNDRESLRRYLEGERLWLENRVTEYYAKHFEAYRDCVTFDVMDYTDAQGVHHHECTGGTVWMPNDNQINVTPKFIWTTWRDEVLTSGLFTDETRERLVEFFAALYADAREGK